MVKVKEDCDQGGVEGGGVCEEGELEAGEGQGVVGEEGLGGGGAGGGQQGKLPPPPSSNLATHHFHYHWSYSPSGAAAPATFHFGPGFEPQTSPHQHVVLFHVNPGVTVSFQMGDSVQVIKGPVTVPMVSTNSSPPIAMPVQVPHGHVVQQIVDENGTLRHVILSPQHPPMVPMPPQHFGPSNPNATNQPQGFYASAMPHGGYSFSPLQPGVLGHGPHPQGHSPPPHSYHKDERTQRQFIKLKRKLEQKQLRENPLTTTPPLSPRKEMNGNSRKGVGSVGTSEDGEESSSLQDEEEDVSLISDSLATIKAPQVSEVTSRTALVQWCPPQLEDTTQELKYDVLLSDRGKEGKYKSIYRGEALSCRIEDLRPGTEYFVCVSARLNNIIGCASEPTVFSTPPCRPDPPPPPKLVSRSKNALSLKWQAAQDNGAHIDCYIVECNMNGTWTEVTRCKNKQAHIPKLKPATPFTFRIAAVNQCGTSDYSQTVKYETCDSPPPQPAVPTLGNATPSSLTLHWQARPQDDDFTLQMDDSDTKHGFLPVFSGKDTSYTCHDLRKNTTYKFRLKSQNEEGSSQWSEEVSFRTLPGRPGPPSRPQLKGRIHSHSFRLRWDPPADKGGAPITAYSVQLMQYNKESDWQVVYSGGNTMCTVERLLPGTAYQVRVCCEGPGGASEFSEVALFATESVCPGQCPPPRLQGKPRSRSVPLKLVYPETDGGSPVIELEVTMKKEKDEEEDPTNLLERTVYKGKETECIINDLRPAHFYSFRVRATNKVGSGPWSDALEVQCGCAAPSRPDPPVVEASGAGVVCTWTTPASNGAPIVQYSLQMSTPPTPEAFTQVYSGTATHCEVKPVPPATICLFRLQASNSIGASEWSGLSSVNTSAGVPGAVPGLKCTPGATSLDLCWGVPQSNGDPVTHYTVEVGDVTAHASTNNYTVENLAPSTAYRVRVRGVNTIGPGSVSSLKVSTLALPPRPPSITCTTAGHNYLKLKWGAPNSNTNNHQYTVTMSGPNSRKTVVYEGTSTSHKVSRLQEQTDYSFTIVAANSTGKGPESEVFTFATVIAPPPTIKGVKVSDVGHKNCSIEWLPLRAQGSDSIDYIAQCARLREQTYKQVYRGKDTRCIVGDLEAGADYLVRIGAVRLSAEGPIEGPFCPPVTLSTPPIPHETTPTHTVRHHTHQGGGRRPLSDQQWAGIILCCFTVLAVLFAVVIANLIY